MAKGTKGTKAQKNGRNGKARETQPAELIPESQQAQVPDGFEEVFTGRVDGWWALVPGNVIRGILRDTFETKSRFKRESDGLNKKRVYKVEVTDVSLSCFINAADGDGEAGEPVEAQLGDMVGIDEKGFLKALSNVLVGQEIWLQYLGKTAPDADNPGGVHRFKGPYAMPGRKVNPVTGEVTS